MNILRFIFPFLFVRNWYDGTWEFSKMRCILFSILIVLVMLGFYIMHALQAPIVYSSNLL
jgi:hypothetical protein